MPEWLQLNNWSIRDRLIMHFLLISMLPALGIGLLTAWAVGGEIESQANEHTFQLIGNVNNQLDFYAGNIQNISYFISFNPDIKRFLKRQPIEGEEQAYETAKFLQGFTTLYPEVAGIMVVNADGDYISNEMYPRSATTRLTEETWYREAVESKGIFRLIGHPVGRNVATHAKYEDEEVVAAVRSILDPETQRVEGVVLIDLKLRAIAETIRDVRLGKSGYLLVLDERGETVYAPGRFAEGFDERRLLAADSGTFVQEVGGERLQFIFQKSSFTNWTTVGVFPVDESAREIRNLHLYLTTFVFVVCLLGIAASYYLSHTISSPIARLASLMRKVEEGNMSIRFNDRRRDEVGTLGRSFNTMLAQIARLLSQVREEQRLKREAELRSLQAHIRPHFLYNTLDTIQWLSRKEGAHEATEMVAALSNLFRIGLSRGKEVIPLNDEMEHIRSYMKIQKTRYRDKLSYTIEASPETAELEVLKVILQPIVENAIYHGVKERRGPGRIAIRAFVHDGDLLLQVEDDGAGMTPETLAALVRKLEATGARAREDGAHARYAASSSLDAAAASEAARGVRSDGTADRRDAAGGRDNRPARDDRSARYDRPARDDRSARFDRSARDDRSGRGEGTNEQGERPESGYGLANVQERLRLGFGDRYGLRIESERGTGTKVTVLHPLLRTKGGHPFAAHLERIDRG